MSKETGVMQKSNGYWEYRFVIVVDGQKIARKKSTDAQGNKLKTKKQAVKAREAAIASAKYERTAKKQISRRTIGEVYAEYSKSGRTGKAYKTIVKQESLWKNHFSIKWGNRFVDDINAAEINDYLSDLYHIQKYSYQYTQSFLRMFYLIIGQAYSRDYLDIDTYNKLCTNKDTRIHMPKLKSDDNLDIVSFSKEELAKLDEYFKGTNAETAYLLGRYCGLRINECFGLKWDHVDFENGSLLIDRQMQYQEGIIKLVPVKTINSRRTIYLNNRLLKFLKQRYEQRQNALIEYAEIIEQKQRFITDLDGSKISSTELINCLPNGTLQTVNSFKYPSREIKASLGINFKYHYLRHTYGTHMAELNTPAHLLCNQMGHGNIHVTQAFYLGVSKTGIELLRDNLNKL